MAQPERPILEPRPLSELSMAVNEIERKLERANAIENPLVRHFTREELWEQYDELQTEIEEAISHSPTK